MPLDLRGIQPDDLPALDVLLREVEAVDETDEHYDLADLEEELADPLLDPARDWLVAVDGDALVGCARLTPRDPGGAALTTYGSGCVHPDRRGEGIGTRLAAAMLARAQERHRELAPHLPAHLKVNGLTEDTVQRDLLAAIGLRPDRYTLTLGVAPVPEQEPGVLPEGLRVRRYDAARDAEALRLVHNEVFRDHPGSTAWTPDEWRHWVTGSRSFRGDVSLLAVDEQDRVVGYVQVDEYDAVRQVTGLREAWIARVGTIREHRGRGLASVLLRHTLEACRQDGFDRAALDVDSANPTGALGVYERAGLSLEKHWTTYVRTDPPVD
ncbi:GNAT family N-acetyltransferase [Nocardioides zeae]|uniref:GNAT family N-acetyltransferase n=1 Tax=Nocardioides zeae TaxID=1457234 RepID=A0A6P0HMD9_9ACTN|nr:GNAT family N-acetyltransferase [Nocardioides zeae]